MRRILVAFAVAMFFPLVEGKAADEKIHQMDWCQGKNGYAEELLDDGTRADCLTETHAIAIKHASEWREVVENLGQAIHYAQQADRQPGIVLVVEDRKDCRYVRRLRKTLKGVLVDENPVCLWTIGPNAEKCQYTEECLK